MFQQLVGIYNAVAYPLCLLLVIRVSAPVMRVWKRLNRIEDVSSDQVAAARQRVSSWANWAIGVACLGWLPGGILFPLAIHLAAGPAEGKLFLHFLLSFTISGLIVLTYSFFGVELMATRVFYPCLLCDETDPQAAAQRELSGSGIRLKVVQLMAGVIPLGGALILLVSGPDPSTVLDSFRLLLMGLIVLGICGFGLAILSAAYLGQTLAALTGRRSSKAARH